jgi:hypothetical protein
MDLALSFYYLRESESVIVRGTEIVPSLFFRLRVSNQFLHSQRIGFVLPILEPIAALLQHKGGLKQSLKSLLVENWFLFLIGHDLFCHVSAPATGSERDFIEARGGWRYFSAIPAPKPTTKFGSGRRCRRRKMSSACLELTGESAIPLIFNSLEVEFNESRLYRTALIRFRGKPFATVNSACKKLHTYPQKWTVRRNRHATIAERSAGRSDSSGRRSFVGRRLFAQVEMHGRSDDE